MWCENRELKIKIVELKAGVENLIKALKEIREGKGAYNQDPLIHCSNTVDDMKIIADKAIKGCTL